MSNAAGGGPPPVILPSTDDTIATLRAALAGRDAWIAGAVPVLRHHEWAGNISNGKPRYCLWCQRSRALGHAPDCQLAKALATAPQP